MVKAIQLNEDGELLEKFDLEEMGEAILYYTEKPISVLGEHDKEGNPIPDRKETAYYMAPMGKVLVYLEDLRDWKSLENKVDMAQAKEDMENYEKAKAWAKTKIQGREAKNDTQREILSTELMSIDDQGIFSKVPHKWRLQVVAEAVKQG